MKFRKFWAFKPVAAVADGVSRAEMTLDGTFTEMDYDWWYGEGQTITSQKFRAELAALGQVDELTVRINSLGGYLVAAIVIHSILREYAGRKIGIVEGVAASAATVVLAACDVIKMHLGTMLLIHQSADSSYGYMNADDHEKAAADLRKWDEAMVALYVQRTGRNEDEVRAQMASDAWMTPTEAQAFGLCDEIIDGQPVTAQAAAGQPNIWAIAGRLFDMSGMTVQPVAMLGEAPVVAATEPETIVVATMIGASLERMESDCPELLAHIRATARQDERVLFTAEVRAEMEPEVLTAAREEGVQAERERQSKLDGYRTAATEEIIAQAKAAGTAPAAVCELIVEAGLKGQAGLEFLRQRAADAHESGANGVAAGVAPEGHSDAADVAQTVAQAKAISAKLWPDR